MSLHDRRDLTQAARGVVTAKAAFILDAASALSIKIGTDGTELVMLVPVKVPYATQRWFATKLEEFRPEVIAHILQEAARPGRRA